jgi:hypothetical protein
VAVFIKTIHSTRKGHIHLMNFHSAIQVHEHYKPQQKTENTEEDTEYTEKKMNILPGKEPGPSSL